MDGVTEVPLVAPGADLSLITLFLHAAYRRQARHPRPARARRSGAGRSSSTRRSSIRACATPDGPFEKVFWSGQSLEELYRYLSGQTPTRHGRGVRRRDARMEAELRGRRAFGDSASRSRIDKVLDVTIAREVDRLERRLLFLATVGSSGPFVGLFGTVWGIMTAFQSIAAANEHVARGGRARHRRGAARHRARPSRRHPGGHRLQQVRPIRRARSASGSKASPTSSRRSCRARSTSGAAALSRWHVGRDRGQPEDAAGGAAAAPPPMSEINVTPFVDVMLVLLIVFMVSAPLLTVGRADRPAARPRPARSPSTSEPITVTVDADGQIYRRRGRGARSSASFARLVRSPANDLDERIFVRGDRSRELRRDHARDGRRSTPPASPGSASSPSGDGGLSRRCGPASPSPSSRTSPSSAGG